MKSRLALILLSLPFATAAFAAERANQKQLVFRPCSEDRACNVPSHTTLQCGTREELAGTVVSDFGTRRTGIDSGVTRECKFYKMGVAKP